MQLTDVGFSRIVDAIDDAPLVPEWAVDRVADHSGGPIAFIAARWDVSPKPKRRFPILTPAQLEIMQKLADGVNVGDIRGDRNRRTTQNVLRSVTYRLGAATNYQALAIAVDLGVVKATQHYVLGPKFQIPPNSHLRKPDRPQHFMSPVLRAVLVGICNGKSSPEIAAELDVPLDTVKSQIKTLRARYNARDRAHIAALAVRHGHVY